YAAFLVGAVSSASGGTYLGESEKGYTLSGFIQDDWRITRNLNINMGLRYDYQQPPYERNCGTSNFNPYAVNPQVNLLGQMQYACKGYGNTYLLPSYRDFGPRIGLAWDPWGKGKTVFRAGYGIFYPSTFNITILEARPDLQPPTPVITPPE